MPGIFSSIFDFEVLLSSISTSFFFVTSSLAVRGDLDLEREILASSSLSDFFPLEFFSMSDVLLLDLERITLFELERLLLDRDLLLLFES